MADELSMFDPETFMNSELEGAMSTSLILIPPQDWPAKITKAVAKKAVVEGEDRGIIDVQWCIEDPACVKVTKQEKNFAKQAIWLDFTFKDNQPALDFSEGKNVALGALREALGQNKERGKWQPQMLVGGLARIRIGHKPDRTNPEIIYNEVRRVAPIAA